MKAEEIKALREKLGLSQKEFATAIGFTTANGPRAVRRLESGDLEPAGSAVAAMHYLDAIWNAASASCGTVAAIHHLLDALPPFLRERAVLKRQEI